MNEYEEGASVMYVNKSLRLFKPTPQTSVINILEHEHWVCKWRIYEFSFSSYMLTCHCKVKLSHKAVFRLVVYFFPYLFLSSSFPISRTTFSFYTTSNERNTKAVKSCDCEEWEKMCKWSITSTQKSFFPCAPPLLTVNYSPPSRQISSKSYNVEMTTMTLSERGTMSKM